MPDDGKRVSSRPDHRPYALQGRIAVNETSRFRRRAHLHVAPRGAGAARPGDALDGRRRGRRSRRCRFRSEGIYAGLFAGSGRTRGRSVDVDGFSNWGMPGFTVDYHDAGFAGGRPDREALRDRAPASQVRVGRHDRRPAGKHRSARPRGPGRDRGIGVSMDRDGACRRSSTPSGRSRSLPPRGSAAARIDNSVSDLDRSVGPGGVPTPWRFDPRRFLS